MYWDLFANGDSRVDYYELKYFQDDEENSDA